MENYPIKSVTFGGFDKQDVINYIEQAAQKAVDAQNELQAENESLREQTESLRKTAEELRTALETLNADKQRLEAELAREASARQELERLKDLEPEIQRLTAEADALRPDAQAYAQFRGRIGAIECEARERAAALEASTAQRLQQTVDQFRGQYQALMNVFEATSAHVTGELRKVEVNLSQLPRAMDKPGVELNELAALLRGEKE